MNFGRVLLLSLVSFLGACTHLEVAPYTPGSSERSGYAYMLPFTQYEIGLTRMLTACKDGKTPDLKIEATVKPELVPDGEHVYLIDQRSLISAFKTTDVSVKMKDGRLVSFNADVEDKTGETIASVAKLAGKVATLAAGIPLPVNVRNTHPYCSALAIDKLDLIKTNKPLIQTNTGLLESATVDLTSLTAQYAEKPTVALGRQIKTKTASIKQAQTRLDAQKKQSADALNWLTEKQTFRWPETSLVFNEEAKYPIRAATLKRWFRMDEFQSLDTFSILTTRTGNPDQGFKTVLANRGSDKNIERSGLSDVMFRAKFPALTRDVDVAVCVANASNPTTLCQQFRQLAEEIYSRQMSKFLTKPIDMRILKLGSYGVTNAAGSSGGPRDGLRYRIPAQGRLYICSLDQDCYANGTVNKPIGVYKGAVAQLGSVFNIPFSSPAFASGNMSVEFDESGQLVSAGLKRTSSAAFAAAEAGNAVGDQILELAKALQEKPISELELETRLVKARKELADAEKSLERPATQDILDEVTLLEAQKKLLEAQKALGPDAVTDLTSQIELIKLQNQLAELQKEELVDPNAGADEVRARYDAEREVIQAEKALVDARRALLEAQQALAEASQN